MTQVSAIESLLTAAGVSKVIGWVNDEIDENTTQEDIDTKVKGPSLLFRVIFADSRIMASSP